ncbi:hypothetical protein, partial [Marivirga sp.]|uniref:hypothetical protein n=1 Tax=Marivirga sp. TaxID=2018662 RepID=UPI003DA71D14
CNVGHYTSIQHQPRFQVFSPEIIHKRNNLISSCFGENTKTGELSFFIEHARFDSWNRLTDMTRNIDIETFQRTLHFNSISIPLSGVFT